MTAYYNEIDPFAAQWLRELIKAGHIAPGDVDERSIEDVTPDELSRYTQCHFFAGIGVWSYSLRAAGWPDDRPIWTGSCPCQPFSAAGKGAGFDDERHLWPSWHWLVRQCRPPIVIGEQVASKTVEPWIDLVHADLEAMGYAFGCVPFPSAGIGAPHIRDRLYWVAYSEGERCEGGPLRAKRRVPQGGTENCSEPGRVGDTAQLSQWPHDGQPGQGVELPRQDRRSGVFSGLANTKHEQRQSAEAGCYETDGRNQEPATVAGFCRDSGPNPTNGFWRAADWLRCRDGKWRPVEPGTFPLVDGAAARVGRLRGYGNAINGEQAKEFIACLL